MASTATKTKFDGAAIVPFLQRRARGFGGKILFMVALGVPLSFIGPVMLGTAFWVVCLLMWHWYSWWWFFWGTFVVVVPALYRMEMRGGDYLTEAVKGAAPGAADASAGLWALSHVQGGGIFAAAAVAAHPRAAAAGFQEIFLFGPRQVVSAVRQWRAARVMRGADVMLAGNVVAKLLGSSKSMGTRELPVGDKMETLGPVLAYLVFYDWVGLSADAKTVWILTEARETLKEIGSAK